MNEIILDFEEKPDFYGDRAYIVVDNILNEEVLDNILLEFPTEDSAFSHKGWNGSRISMQYGHRNFNEFIASTKGFKNVFDYLTSEYAYDYFLNIFSSKLKILGLKNRYLDKKNITFDSTSTTFFVTTNILKRIYIRLFYNPIYRKYNIRSFVKYLIRFFRKPIVYPLFSINYSDQGYFQPEHTDCRYKVMVGLIYLDDLDDGGELVLYKNKKETSLEDSIMYPKSGDLDEVVRIKSKRNRLVLFLNSNNLIHGTTEFSGVRRFIYFSYAFKDEESCFETSYPVYKGDAVFTEV